MGTNNKKAEQATVRESRRFLIRVLLCGALLGGVLFACSPRNSAWSTIGSVLVLLCLVPVGATLRWSPHLFLTLWTGHAVPDRDFASGDPVPELLVNLRLFSPAQAGRELNLGPGRHTLALVIGTEGYTVRFDLDAPLDTRVQRTVEVEFLNPALALPRFAVGTVFRMLAHGGVIGEGVVLARLGAAPRAGR